MKKLLCVVTVLVLILSIHVTAFAQGSPTASDPSVPAADSSGPVTDGSDLAVCDASGDTIDVIPSNRVVRLGVGQAGLLAEESRNTFMTALTEARDVTERLVRYFFWLNVNDYSEPDGFAYYKFPFTCDGEDVQVTVNGKSMEVVKEESNSYFAKLTELGVVVISCDK